MKTSIDAAYQPREPTVVLGNPVGIHLVLDAWEAPPTLLNDPEAIKRALIRAVHVGGATLINLCLHQFSPYGVTATATLAESHIAIHTWPEHGYFAADLFFCGEGDPYKAVRLLQTALQAGQAKLTEIQRGIPRSVAVPAAPNGVSCRQGDM